MNKSKKETTAGKPSIQINRNRGGGKKKPDLFANLRREHPLDEMFHNETQIAEFPAVELPSTFNIDSRPQNSISAVHSFETLPSTLTEDERPQILELPSTKNSVDVLPSTDPILPSTTKPETPNVDVLPSTQNKSAVHKLKTTPSTKSDRHSKDLARYDNRIDTRTKKQIDMFCAKFNISQREFAEQSAVHFIEMWTAKFSRIVDGKTAQDDRLMMMWKTCAPIINLYRAYNFENKWKFRDDEVASKLSLVDLRLIEIGIISTQFNANFKKINSFEYYKNEIDSFIEQKLAPEMLNFLLDHYREKWQKATGKKIDYTQFETLKSEGQRS